MYVAGGVILYPVLFIILAEVQKLSQGYVCVRKVWKCDNYRCCVLCACVSESGVSAVEDA